MAIASSLVKHGATVVVADLQKPTIELPSGMSFAGLDVRDVPAVQRLMAACAKRLGREPLSPSRSAQRLGAMLVTLLASTVQHSQRLDSSFASISEQDPACEFFKCLLFWARLCCL